MNFSSFTSKRSLVPDAAPSPPMKRTSPFASWTAVCCTRGTHIFGPSVHASAAGCRCSGVVGLPLATIPPRRARAHLRSVNALSSVRGSGQRRGAEPAIVLHVVDLDRLQEAAVLDSHR
jgi:hypothetical protein